jgi:DNA-binding transcriptional MerR regulator
VRTHTIGEVLNRLKDEFDDITISKIRFLEAEGLISPDRTESGYRKFTPGDIDRLRYVLRAQRDRYLPLKVIKDELARIDAGLPVTARRRPPIPATAGPLPGPRGAGRAPPPVGTRVVGPADAPGRVRAARPDEPPERSSSRESELADASGLTDRDVASLRDHGLLSAGPDYDGDDLRVVKLAAELLDAGLEARHLRMYRQFADREAALAEQLVAPMLRQRNPDSRRSATEQAERLARVGGSLHRTLLARSCVPCCARDPRVPTGPPPRRSSRCWSRSSGRRPPRPSSPRRRRPLWVPRSPPVADRRRAPGGVVGARRGLDRAGPRHAPW